MRYRRAYTPGASYFFTVNTLQRDKNLLVDHIDLLKQSIHQVKSKHSFYINAIVVLPDHIHTVWTLPDHDCDFSMRWRLIKSAFSRELPYNEPVKINRRHKGERGIWQRRFWEHLIRDEQDFTNHINYIHINPVKHGYVQRPADWPYSSVHKYIRKNLITADWACDTNFPKQSFGEAT